MKNMLSLLLVVALLLSAVALAEAAEPAVDTAAVLASVAPAELLADYDSIHYHVQYFDENMDPIAEAENTYILIDGKWQASRVTNGVDEEDGTAYTYYSDTVYTENGSATYSFVDYGAGAEEMTVVAIPTADYDHAVADSLCTLLDADFTEEVVEVSEQDEAIILETAVSYEGSVMEKRYYYLSADLETLYAVDIEFVDEDGNVTMMMACTEFAYDEPVDNAMTAKLTCTEADERCEVTVITEPGTDRSETLVYNVVRGTEEEPVVLYVVGAVPYEIYADEACTESVDVADTTSEASICYAVPMI